MSDEPQDQTFVELEAGSEWRFELEADEDMAVRVQSPDPTYINGEELPPTTWYPLHRHLKSSIYAPSPARLEVTSLPASQYTSSSTTLPSIIALHLALERLRILAKRNVATPDASHTNGDVPLTSRGPRVMVLGPPSSGKTTVMKSLVNLALGSGMGWSPGVISLDPSSPSNLIPGSLSLSTPSHPLPTHHPTQPFGPPPASAPSNTLSADVPTVGWWYGHLEPTTKGVELWRKLVGTMGDAWRERCAKDSITMASGCFVDTSSAFTNPLLGTRKDNPKARYSLVLEAIKTFDIDTILVISHEKLQIDLSRLIPSPISSVPFPVQVLRIPKSGGTVDLDDAYRQLVHSQQVRSYFYGEPSPPKCLEGVQGRVVGLGGGLSPYSFQIGWGNLTILRVGEEGAAPSSALPLGSSRILSPTRLTRVDPSGPAHVTRLLNTVLALAAVTPSDRIVKVGDKVKEEKKPTIEKTGGTAPAETTAEDGDGVKVEAGDGGEETQEEGGDEDVDVDEDEVPYKEEIGYREILGFVVITAIDHQRKKYTVLSPSPGKLPSTVALAGSVEWVDSE